MERVDDDKKLFENASILIIDDDDEICRVLKGFATLWGMNAHTHHEQVFPAGLLKRSMFDVVLLDVRLGKVSGLDWLPEIVTCCPDAKVIVMTGYASKETVLQALRLGAADFLEKPIESGFLYHSIHRALDVREKEHNLRKLSAEVARGSAELVSQKEKLEHLTERLLELNRAFATLARSLDLEREQMQNEIAQRLSSTIVPIIERLLRASGLQKYAMELNLLKTSLDDLSSGFTLDARMTYALSAAELRVASLIKEGWTTEQIASHLHIAPDTVRTHRKNIRKKLKIQGNSYSLKEYLQSKMDLH